MDAGWRARVADWLEPPAPAPLYGPLLSLRSATGWVGGAVDPASLRGRVTLIVFFVHDDVRCASAMLEAEAMHRAYGPLGLAVVGVHEPAFGADVAAVVGASVRALGVAFPVALDGRSAAWDAFKNRFWPALYLVGRDGELRHVQLGDDHPERIEAKVRALLTSS